MRLLMLNNEYPPIGGGTATANYHVVRVMAAHGLHVDLVTSTPNNRQFEVETLGDTVRVFRVPIANDNPHYQTEQQLLNYIWHAFFFIRTLYRGTGPRYDLCHAWSGLPAGALAYLLKWKRGLRYIVGLRGSDVPGYDVRYRKLYPVLKPFLHAIWSGADGLTANSYELRNLALQFRPHETISVIPNGVALDRFTLANHTPRAADRPFTILCVARLVARKGIDDLIDAVPILRQHTENFRVVLVGIGDLERHFRSLVADRDLGRWVEFRGAVMHYDIAHVYNEADVFVLPSLNEGMSNAVLEAMASGLPLVTTYTGGTAETLRGNGIVVPMKAPDAIAEALLELMRDDALRLAMGQRSRAIAEQMTWDHVAEAYIDTYAQVLGQPAQVERMSTHADEVLSALEQH